MSVIPSENWFQEFVFDLWDPDPTERDRRISQYKMFPRDEVVPLLRKFLGSPMDGLVWRAAYLLLHEDVDRHLDAVLYTLRSPSVDIRYVICGVLHDLSVTGAREALEKTAETDTSGRVRFAAVKALARCGSRDSIQVLQRILDNDKDDDGQGRPISLEAQSAMQRIQGEVP